MCLGLKPSQSPLMRIAEPNALHAPLPDPDQPLTMEELAEAWRRYVPAGFSALRRAISVLDAHGRPMNPEDVLAYVAERTAWRNLSVEAAHYWGSNGPVHVREDGMWEVRTDHKAVHSARRAVRALVAAERRSGYLHPDRATAKAEYERREQEKEAHAEQMERWRRVLVYAFPSDRPEAIVLIDVNRRRIETLVGPEMQRVRERLMDFDVIVGVDVHKFLQTVAFDPGARCLAELRPPQKSLQLNRHRRTLKITTKLLIRGSCGISHPFGTKATMLAYLREGQDTRFRRRVEADAKSLLALYQYGCLHHTVRLRWGFLDQKLPAPWVHCDEHSLYDLLRRSNELDAPLEIVVGSAPGWDDPWARARVVRARMNPGGWRYDLVDEKGHSFREEEVQAARLLADANHGSRC